MLPLCISAITLVLFSFSPILSIALFPRLPVFWNHPPTWFSPYNVTISVCAEPLSSGCISFMQFFLPRICMKNITLSLLPPPCDHFYCTPSCTSCPLTQFPFITGFYFPHHIPHCESSWLPAHLSSLFLTPVQAPHQEPQRLWVAETVSVLL